TAAIRPSFTATSPAKPGAPEPSTTRPPLIRMSNISVLPKSAGDLAPGLADQAVQPGRLGGAQQVEPGFGVEHDGARDAIAMSQPHQQFGRAVMAGDDLGGLDHRVVQAAARRTLRGGDVHASGGSTKTTSLPSNRPRGLRMAKMCRFQPRIRSIA